MKNFTKLFLSAMLLIGSANLAKSQDVGVVAIITPTPNGDICPNVPQRLSFTLQNFSTSALTAAQADSVIIELRVNGVYAQMSYSTPGDLNLAGSATIDLTNNTATDWSTLGLGNTPGNVNVAVRSRLKKNNVDVDINASNDETFAIVSYPGDNSNCTWDLAPTNLTCSVPTYNSGDHVPLGGVALTLAYDLMNSGSNNLFPGIPYTYDISVAGTVVTSTPITATVNGFLAPSGTEVHTINSTVTFPMTKGPFQLCLELTPSSDDLDNTNDKTCLDLIAGNPDGIADVDAPVYGDIYYHSNVLNMKFNELAKGNVTVNIFETSGRNAGEYTFNVDSKKNHELDLSKLATGMYIANVMVNGDLLSYQFMAQ